MWRNRIVTDENILVGKPIIKGTRISVEFILELLGEGWNLEGILKNYPQLEKEDVLASLKYSAEALKKEKTFAL